MTPEPFNLQAPITQSRFAEVIGVTRQAVNAMCREGLLAPGATAGEWLRAYTTRLREQAAGRLGDASGEGLDLVQERAHLAKVQREQIELKLAVTRGELLEAAPLRAEWGRALSNIRDRLLQMPDRLAPVLATTTDARLCRSAIADEVHAALSQLSEGGAA